MLLTVLLQQTGTERYHVEIRRYGANHMLSSENFPDGHHIWVKLSSDQSTVDVNFNSYAEMERVANSLLAEIAKYRAMDEIERANVPRTNDNGHEEPVEVST